MIGTFTCGFAAHGPALTLKYTHEKIQFPMGIDISTAISTNLSFEQLQIQWPRKAWPSKELQRAIKKKGVMLVAKQNFFWSASFVECEKELSTHADEDGGIRMTVHKMMKIFNDRFWRKQTKQLDSYMLKVKSVHINIQLICPYLKFQSQFSSRPLFVV